jgi:uncharacterized protein
VTAQAAPEKPAPLPTPETAPFFAAAARGELALPFCDVEDRPFMVPRRHCPTCGSDRISWRPASGRATLHSYVVNHRPAPGFATPHVIAIVRLAEGPTLMTNLVDVAPDPAALVLDMPLTVRFEQRGDQVVAVFAPDPGGTS